MTKNKNEVRYHHVDGSEYDEAILQRQLCSMLQIALNDGCCMKHAKKDLIKYLARQIKGYRQAKPRKEEGWLEADNADSGSHVEIAIHLFGLPDFELDDYELTGPDIRDYATASREWLTTVAEAVDKLLGDGWTVRVVKSNVEARHPEVRTCKEAVERLGHLQIEEAIMLDIDIAEFSAERERLSPV